MFIRLLLAFSWVLVAGFIFVSLILKKDREDYSDVGLRLWLGLGVGFGLASFNFFLWQLIFDPQTEYFIIGEIFILILLIGLYFRKLEPYKNASRFFRDLAPGKPTLLALIFSILIISAIAVHLHGFVIRPQGGWDAWMIWNKHARFLYRDYNLWRRVFSTIQQHPDYPLLIPANVARSWAYMGKESVFAPALLGFIYVFSILGLLVMAVRALKGSKTGYLAGFILMAAPVFHVHGPTQSADFPLAFCLLAAVVLLNFSRERNNDQRYLILAGIIAAFGVWTKNEGWLLITALGIARLVAYFIERDKEVFRREVIPFLSGALPILALTLFYKFVFAPENDLVAGQGISTLARLTDKSRYLEITRSFFLQLIRLDPKYSVPFIILPIFALIFGIIPGIFRDSITITNILTPLLILSGYYFIFITTPHDLEWHIYTANTRLFFQVWPVSVLATSLIIKISEQRQSSS